MNAAGMLGQSEDAAAGRRKLIYLLAGEPSGDNLGGRIMRALKTRAAVPLDFVGVGGEQMTAEGLETLVPLSELSIMGMAEILPHVPRMYRLIWRLARDIRQRRPDVVLTIDNTAFNFAVANRARGHGIPLVHLNAPKVWAYRPGRVWRVARYYDHLLCLLPFEPPYFHRVGMPASFIGHPVVESGADRGDGPGFRRRHGIADDALLLCVLPGSRAGEVKRLLPVFEAAIRLIAPHLPELRLVMPTVPSVEQAVRAAAAGWQPVPIVTADAAERFNAFAASDLALAASGTVSLELNLARVPMVIAYRVSETSAAIVRRLMSVRHITIANLVLGDRPVIPELVQENCTPARLAATLLGLIADPAARAGQVRQGSEAMRLLGAGGPLPSLRAADILLDIAGIAQAGAP